MVDSFHAFDLQPPAKQWTPAFSPIRRGYSPPWSDLPNPADGHVWVRLIDDYYEGVQWEVVQPGRVQMDLKRVRQITTAQLAAWNAAKDAYDEVQDEAWKLYVQQEAA